MLVDILVTVRRRRVGAKQITARPKWLHPPAGCFTINNTVNGTPVKPRRPQQLQTDPEEELQIFSGAPMISDHTPATRHLHTHASNSSTSIDTVAADK